MSVVTDPTTFTITDLPEDVATRLAALPSDERNAFAIDALRDAFGGDIADAERDAAEIHTWWESLTEAEREAEREKSRRSAEAVDAGRGRPAEQVFAHLLSRRK